MQRAALSIAAAGSAAALLLVLRRRRDPRHRHLAWVARLMAEGKLPALREEMFVAVTLALECGEAIRATTSAKTMWKDAQGIDPVTATDQANEKLVTDTLKRRFPSHRVVGEEAAAEGAGVPALTFADPPTWYVDPIDGTQNFVHAVPISCVSIGLAMGGMPLLGVIYHPGCDELFVGLADHGSFLNGTRLQADHGTTALGEAMVLTDVGYERSEAGVRKISGMIARLMGANVRAVRMIGSTAICLAWVAAGRASGFYAGLHKRDCPKQWDWCAGHAIVCAAGGVFLRHGAQRELPFDIDCSGCVCAGSPELAVTLQREVDAVAR